MRLLTYRTILILLSLPCLFAAPTSTASPLPDVSSPASVSLTHDHDVATTHTGVHSPHIPFPTTTPHRTVIIQHHRPPPPTSQTRSPEPSTSHPASNKQHSTQKPIAIFFEVACGLIGLAFIIGLLRCLYSYKRTPNRDRIAAVVSRHRLQQELDELERNPLALRRSSGEEPAPPYLPPPPSYAEIPMSSTSQPLLTRYIEVPISSPESPPHSLMEHNNALARR